MDRKQYEIARRPQLAEIAKIRNVDVDDTRLFLALKPYRDRANKMVDRAGYDPEVIVQYRTGEMEG